MRSLTSRESLRQGRSKLAATVDAVTRARLAYETGDPLAAAQLLAERETSGAQQERLAIRVLLDLHSLRNR